MIVNSVKEGVSERDSYFLILKNPGFRLWVEDSKVNAKPQPPGTIVFSPKGKRRKMVKVLAEIPRGVEWEALYIEGERKTKSSFAKELLDRVISGVYIIDKK